MSTSAAKWSEGLSNRVSVIISRYIHHMRYGDYMVVPFITFFHSLLVLFLSWYIWLCVLCTSV